MCSAALLDFSAVTQHKDVLIYRVYSANDWLLEGAAGQRVYVLTVETSHFSLRKWAKK